MHFGNDQAQDLEKRTFGGVLAGHDAKKRFALFRRGTLVDDRLYLAVAFVQRPGEINSNDENEAVEPGLLEMPFGNPHAEQALAITTGRQGIEIARTAKRAIAVLDPFAFETPVRSSHGTPPVALSVGPQPLGKVVGVNQMLDQCERELSHGQMIGAIRGG